MLSAGWNAWFGGIVGFRPSVVRASALWRLTNVAADGRTTECAAGRSRLAILSGPSAAELHVRPRFLLPNGLLMSQPDGRAGCNPRRYPTPDTMSTQLLRPMVQATPRVTDLSLGIGESAAITQSDCSGGRRRYVLQAAGASPAARLRVPSGHEPKVRDRGRRSTRCSSDIL